MMTSRVLLLLLCILPVARAEVALPAVLSKGMVLQRGSSVPIWGTAANGEKVTVSFRGATATATAADGKWSLRIAPGEPGGPFTMTVKGTNDIIVDDVLVGDV